MGASYRNLKAYFRGLDPFNCIFDNFLNVWVIEGSAILVSWLEIEYFAGSAEEAAATPENKSVLIPSAEHKRVGLGNIEGLAI